jgi:hypothetical protein
MRSSSPTEKRDYPTGGGARSSYPGPGGRARTAALAAGEAASPIARRTFDLRHAVVSTWLNAGVPPTRVADRAGRGVDVLLRVYARQTRIGVDVRSGERPAPIDPVMDRNQGKRRLADAGVRPAQLRDARHTAATVLVLLVVPDPAAMEVMGLSDGRSRSATCT